MQIQEGAAYGYGAAIAAAFVSVHIPLEWENASCIEPEKLCAVPDYLDKFKDEIDGHLNMQIRQREMVSGNFHLLYTGAL